MPYRRISADLKERALELWERGWLTEDLLDIFDVSRASMYRWRACRARYGSLHVPRTRPRGRPRILTGEQSDALCQYLERNAWRYLDEIQEWLAIEHDVTISRSALQENIQEAGLTYKVLRQKALRQNAAAVAAFRDFQHTLRARMCVCVDESSKDNRTVLRRYGWAPRGQRAQTRSELARGDRYSILPAMSVDGYIALRVVNGSVNGFEFADFIVTEVMPKMNPFPGDRSVLIMDNCSIHKTEFLSDMARAAGILLVYIPPYSPEFNPIEESFHAVKAYLRRNFERLYSSTTPDLDLYEACETVTAEKAAAFFVNSGYRL